MATKIIENYKWVIEDLSDARVKNWLFMSSPIWPFIICVIYLYIVYVVTPKFMKNRKAYKLKSFLIVYNFLQIISNFGIFYSLLTSVWLTTYTIGCQLIDYSSTPEALWIAKLVWYTLILKLVDLIETPIFILRKKYNQVTGLHVYHHVSTFIILWIGVKYVAGGMATFSLLLNSFIHTIMYSYYLLALSGPKMQKRLFKFKKSLTILQMVQFLIILLHSFQALSPNCHVPKILAYIFIPNVIVIFYLFYQFFKQAYNKRKNKQS